MTHSQGGKGKKVVLAMSGGVDSSAAAVLLKEQGYDVVGCFMRLGSEDEEEPTSDSHCELPILGTQPNKPKKHKQGCCSVNDADDARLVAAMLDIPFYVLNFRKDFARIMDYFVAEYNAGRTPNPCVRCNDWLKFGRLHQYAQSIGADFVASGHYARTDLCDPNRPRLMRGIDRHKDQSYVLFGAPRNQLKHMLLPLGGYEKPAIRKIAEDHNLPVFNKPDSQEICFVPDNDYAGLVERRTQGGFATGDILDRAGNVLGQHDGHQHFTLGQRRGIGIAMPHPLYIIDKDPAKNTVTVGEKTELLSTGCTATQTNWLIDAPIVWTPCQAKARYNSEPTPAKMRSYLDEAGETALEVKFNSPIEAITPGQAIVCYGQQDSPYEEDVLCGGWIESVTR